MCFPGLHLSLGIFDRLWTLLEEACTELDLYLAESASHDWGAADTFDRYASALNHLSELKEKRFTQEQQSSMLSQLATYLSLTPSNNGAFLLIRREASLTTQAIAQTVKMHVW